MLNEAVRAWDQNGLGVPITQQVRTELWLDGLEVPIIGYADYILDGFCLDLKTTLRCPSSPRFNHALQISGYAKARSEDRGGLFYVTPKKSAIYMIGQEEIDRSIADVHRRALSVQTSLRMAMDQSNGSVNSAKHLLAQMCPPDLDSFYWSDAGFAAAQSQIPAWQ